MRMIRFRRRSVGDFGRCCFTGLVDTDEYKTVALVWAYKWYATLGPLFEIRNDRCNILYCSDSHVDFHRFGQLSLPRELRRELSAMICRTINDWPQYYCR
jgi:hypothetical protein